MVTTRDHTRRNLGIFTGSAVTFALLMLYPTSTNSGTGHPSGARQLAAAGVVQGAEAATVVVNGTPVIVKYGTVQVQIAVQAGRIIRATAINYPQDNGRDQEINGFAIPQLQRETVEAQGGHIDAITGATFTSKGYAESLQAALDAAHLN